MREKKENWLKIDGYSNLFEVSDQGNVRRIDSDKVFKQTIHKSGYKNVILSVNNKKHFALVHRLVASAFIENPNGYSQVNHIDGNKENNSVDNLEWCSASQNIVHALKHGLNNHKRYLYFMIDNNGNILDTYKSQADIRHKLNIRGQGVYEACNNGKKYKGYFWKREEIQNG